MIKIYVIKYKEDPIYVGTTTKSLREVMTYYYAQIYGIDVYDKKLCTINLLEEAENRLPRNFWVRHFLDKGCKLLNIYTGYKINEYKGECKTSNQKYHHSEYGRIKLKEAQERYRQTDKYKAYQRKYRSHQKLKKYGFD